MTREQRREWIRRGLELAATSDALDRPLGWLLARPRTLQACALMLCALLLLTTAIERPFGSLGAVPSIQPAEPPAAELAKPAGDARADVISAVTAYNQASIAAGRTGRIALLLPHLEPSGNAAAQARAEFVRRSRSGEIHEATLRRWGVLRVEIGGERATVETQELWDDRVWQAHALVRSRRGILSRNTYDLRLSEGWRIDGVTTVTVVE